jgi:hypothetical protein
MRYVGDLEVEMYGSLIQTLATAEEINKENKKLIDIQEENSAMLRGLAEETEKLVSDTDFEKKIVEANNIMVEEASKFSLAISELLDIKLQSAENQTEKCLARLNKSSTFIRRGYFWENVIAVGLCYSVFFGMVGLIIGMTINDGLTVTHGPPSFVQSTNVPNEYHIAYADADMVSGDGGLDLKIVKQGVGITMKAGLLYPYYKWGLFAYVIFFAFFAFLTYVTYFVTRNLIILKEES